MAQTAGAPNTYSTRISYLYCVATTRSGEAKKCPAFLEITGRMRLHQSKDSLGQARHALLQPGPGACPGFRASAAHQGSAPDKLVVLGFFLAR